jgi:hypothetical protein
MGAINRSLGSGSWLPTTTVCSFPQPVRTSFRGCRVQQWSNISPISVHLFKFGYFFPFGLLSVISFYEMGLSASCPIPNLESQALIFWLCSCSEFCKRLRSTPSPLVVELSGSSAETLAVATLPPSSSLDAVLPDCWNIKLRKGGDSWGWSLDIPHEISSRVSVLTVPTNVLLIVPDIRIGDTEYHVKVGKVCGRHWRFEDSCNIYRS